VAEARRRPQAGTFTGPETRKPHGDQDGAAKILDFAGEARDRDRQRELPTVSRTEPGPARNGQLHVAEQASGRRGLSLDQFSFGSILYEMLTGRKAFHRETAVDTLAAILREPETLTRSCRYSATAPVGRPLPDEGPDEDRLDAGPRVI
jgi:hypothetical protein